MKQQNQKYVLIIEDEPIFRMNYRTVLTNEGYYIEEAATGLAGYEIAKLNRPDMILLDLILPEANGYETLEKIRALYHDLPIIVFSVLSSEEDIEKAMRLGANDFAVKGLEPPSAILDKISALL